MSRKTRRNVVAMGRNDVNRLYVTLRHEASFDVQCKTHNEIKGDFLKENYPLKISVFTTNLLLITVISKIYYTIYYRCFLTRTQKCVIMNMPRKLA